MRTAFNIILATLTLALLTPSPPAAHAGNDYTLTIFEKDSTTVATGITLSHTFGSTTADFTDITNPDNSKMMIFSSNNDLGALNVTITTGVEVISPTDVRLDLSDMNFTTNAPGVITASSPAVLIITLTQDGNTLATTGPTSAAFSLLAGGTLDDGVNFTTSATLTHDSSGPSTTLDPVGWYKAQPSPNPAVLVPGDTANGPGAYNTFRSGSAGLSGPTDSFSLTLSDTFTFTQAGSVSSFDSTAEASVPEPGTLAILGSGLPLMGLSALRRRRKKARLA